MNLFDLSTPVSHERATGKRCRQAGSTLFVKEKRILLYFSMNYRDFSVKSKLIISLCQTVKLSLSISLFQKIGFS